MTSLKLIGAAAIAASTLAGPAMGQSSITNPAACESMFASANCLNAGAGSPYATSRQERQYRRTAYRQQNRNDSGFWPVDTAGAVAGAAVGTAAAVATAPFRGWGNSYAYDTSGGYNGNYNRGEMGWYGNWDTYAARNGIVCRPGTWVKGEDGRRHICQ
ncbi:hypothetical protein [Bradyrhizobium arachidis]|jgi:hypothetical protein|uniref:YXWGXW repeat-containing protein n=1 Tax=Bradyrhizobium arachidis TaxID=858423 RepID=A0AAE7NTR0_9BRAD|nr:hypothetical protein [Bradyrhizobium arachidis]QOZ70130.1 hypothetical protein WN72_30345 [Bradyrhizobium arachidis]SFV19741.1 hypothetical protein SAMN05192541_16020 [Bradyrhizobium arachidis]